jgi:hypothetical protein
MKEEFTRPYIYIIVQERGQDIAVLGQLYL